MSILLVVGTVADEHIQLILQKHGSDLDVVSLASDLDEVWVRADNGVCDDYDQDDPENRLNDYAHQRTVGVRLWTQLETLEGINRRDVKAVVRAATAQPDCPSAPAFDCLVAGLIRQRVSVYEPDQVGYNETTRTGIYELKERGGRVLV